MKINPNIIVLHGSGRDIQNFVSLTNEAAEYSNLYVDCKDEKLCKIYMDKYESTLSEMNLLYSAILNKSKRIKSNKFSLYGVK
jgi:hypothetical protein